MFLSEKRTPLNKEHFFGTPGISNIDKKHTIRLKINFKMQEDELKNCPMMTWKSSWRNVISFAPPPSPNKMSLHTFKIWFFSDIYPPFCTMSFIFLFIFLKSSLIIILKNLISLWCWRSTKGRVQKKL